MIDEMKAQNCNFISIVHRLANGDCVGLCKEKLSEQSLDEKWREIVTRRGVLALLGIGAVLAATPYFWNRRWRYITIHHSGGEYGNVKLLQRVHRERQPRDPIDAIPYHFLIGNGNGLGLGEVVETWRWRFGIWGAHLSARNMQKNFRGIGVCLIGNFQTGEVPETQLSAAIALTQSLMRRLHIPPENVTLHGTTPGEATLCPGKNFPQHRFMSAIADHKFSDGGLPDRRISTG